MDHASQLATRVKAVPIDCLSRLSDDADVYIIAVSDDALPEVAKDVQVKDALVMERASPLFIARQYRAHRLLGIMVRPLPSRKSQCGEAI